MKKISQSVVQIAFLVLFILLIAKGKVQMWMGLFVLAIVVAFVSGRLYCGWVCPINTVMRGITVIKNKLHIKSVNTPAFLTKPWVRILVLVLFVAVFIFTMVTGKKLPVLPALFVLGALLTLIFPEELWHRYLCPYGTILSLAAWKTRRGMTIDQDLCNSCGACMRVCPAKAVERSGTKYSIIKKDCIMCMDCARACKGKIFITK